MTPKTWKNRPQKLLIIGPDPFISQSSPDHSPQPRIDFSYYEISGPNICSLICAPSIWHQSWFMKLYDPFWRKFQPSVYLSTNHSTVISTNVQQSCDWLKNEQKVGISNFILSFRSLLLAWNRQVCTRYRVSHSKVNKVILLW